MQRFSSAAYLVNLKRALYISLVRECQSRWYQWSLIFLLLHPPAWTDGCILPPAMVYNCGSKRNLAAPTEFKKALFNIFGCPRCTVDYLRQGFSTFFLLRTPFHQTTPRVPPFHGLHRNKSALSKISWSNKRLFFGDHFLRRKFVILYWQLSNYWTMHNRQAHSEALKFYIYTCRGGWGEMDNRFLFLTVLSPISTNQNIAKWFLDMC